MTETMEGAARADADADTTDFEARIVSIDFVDSVKLMLDGAAVKGPHWTYGERDTVIQDWSTRATLMRDKAKSFSKKPAAYFKGGGTKITLKVEITKSKNVSGDATVRGAVGSLVIEGTCPTSAGEHTINATLSGWTDSIHAFVGKLPWTIAITSPSRTMVLGSTFIELYYFLDKPRSMYKNGLPSEVLRFLARRVKVVGKKTARQVAVAVTRYTHTSHDMHYDTFEGGSQFGVVSMTIPNFPIVDYVLRNPSKVNCYDQAAAVQSLVGAVGVDTDFIFMEPYGFINDTILVGVPGRCNNPFFMLPNSFDHTLTTPHLDVNDKRQSAFWNHAFCRFDGDIFDSCAGPHVGGETLPQYIIAAIDQTTVLNTPASGYPGTIGNAKPYRGVISVSPTSSA